jgi:hypothetical protein
MASLTDLFNPTFLMFLGILVLVVALLVVYFENKFRDQNHKITSMLSLVSSLAEELNNVKIGLNHLSMRGGGINYPIPSNIDNHILYNPKTDLISVSDDEKEDDEEEDLEDSEDELEAEEDSDEEEDNKSTNILEITNHLYNDDENENENIDLEEKFMNNSEVKILKINFDTNENTNNFDNNSELDDLYELEDDLDDIDDLDDNENDNENISEKKYTQSPQNILDYELNNDFTDINNNSEILNISSSLNLKSINIHLEESKNDFDNIDFKKLSLNRLRKIVSEKNIVTDSSKLKKPELLKLLGVE